MGVKRTWSVAVQIKSDIATIQQRLAETSDLYRRRRTPSKGKSSGSRMGAVRRFRNLQPRLANNIAVHKNPLGQVESRLQICYGQQS
jgi:hypothetical protein